MASRLLCHRRVPSSVTSAERTNTGSVGLAVLSSPPAGEDSSLCARTHNVVGWSVSITAHNNTLLAVRGPRCRVPRQRRSPATLSIGAFRGLAGAGGGPSPSTRRGCGSCPGEWAHRARVRSCINVVVSGVVDTAVPGQRRLVGGLPLGRTSGRGTWAWIGGGPIRMSTLPRRLPPPPLQAPPCTGRPRPGP
eukprot:COSAG01_NODE_994_length_12252_cov_10.271044_14_plen_192_part_00